MIYMTLKKEIIKKRLKEAFGTDTQTVVGRKLNVQQGTVSKLLSGDQEPTGELLFNIAEAYDVSVDWILGISDEKRISRNNLTYADILKGFTKMGEMGAMWPYPNHMISVDGTNPEIPQVTCVGINDEILQSILHEWRQMKTASPDIYRMWLEKRMEEYSKIPYIVWSEDVKELFHQTQNIWDVKPEFLQRFYDRYQEELKKRYE